MDMCFANAIFYLKKLRVKNLNTIMQAQARYQQQNELRN